MMILLLTHALFNSTYLNFYLSGDSSFEVKVFKRILQKPFVFTFSQKVIFVVVINKYLTNIMYEMYFS